MFPTSLFLVLSLFTAESGPVKLTTDAVDASAGGLACYKIETPRATYYLEKSGAGLSSLIDSDGNDWLGFHPQAGSGAGGEYRGFPNAVHQQGGNYFHPRNKATDAATTQIERAGAERVTISAAGGEWACQYDFYPTHCTFTMTKVPAGFRYWVLYEGTPGGEFDDADWWMTSAHKEPTPLATPHEGDIPAPEWIAFGDRRQKRVLALLHHEDDDHPDYFYQMQRKMTVFGFGRRGLDKFLDTAGQQFSLGLIESTSHAEVGRAVEAWQARK